MELQYGKAKSLEQELELEAEQEAKPEVRKSLIWNIIDHV